LITEIPLEQPRFTVGRAFFDRLKPGIPVSRPVARKEDGSAVRGPSEQPVVPGVRHKRTLAAAINGQKINIALLGWRFPGNLMRIIKGDPLTFG
jgi:hypothetical protein